MNDRVANVRVTVRGVAPETAAAYALGKIRHVVGRAPGRVGDVHVVLGVTANPAHETPAAVDVAADVAGRPIHVHVAARELNEAIDEAADRLRRQLTDLRERPLSRRHAARPQPEPVTEAQD